MAQPGQEKWYEASINGYTDVGGHVEYCVKLCHCSGVSWSLWRRFSEFSQLHEDILRLTDEKDQLPPGRSWLPAFTQSLSADFCEQREVELGAYLKRLIAPKMLEMSPLQDFLGIRCPEPPAGLRVVPRGSALELEVSPPDSETFPSPRMGEQGGPVDGYWIEILNLDTGKKNRLKREVGASGRLLQLARVGCLEPGRHCFACAAFNVAGCSSPVSVTVDPAVLCAPEQNPVRMQQSLSTSPQRGYLPRPELADMDRMPCPSQAQGPVQLPQPLQLPRHQYQPQYYQQCTQQRPQQPANWSAGPSIAKPLAAKAHQSHVGAANPSSQEDEDSLCVVCLASPKTHAFVPCGHRCVCANCAKEVFEKGNCPVCRTEAQNVIHIFT